MRILVIGGTSFIGPRVVNLLTGMGYQVAVYHRGPSMGQLSDPVKHIFAERKNLLQHTADFINFAPDLVLDMILSKEEDARILLDTFRGICHRIVAISSQDVCRAYGLVRNNEAGAGEPIPVTEQSRLREKLYPYQDPRRTRTPGPTLTTKYSWNTLLWGTPTLPVRCCDSPPFMVRTMASIDSIRT